MPEDISQLEISAAIEETQPVSLLAGVTIRSPVGAETGQALNLRNTSDAQNRFQFDHNGRHRWGPGGSSLGEITLERSSSGLLTLGGSLQITADLQVDDDVTVTGDLAVSGPLAVSGVFTAPGFNKITFNATPNTPPSSPADGDIWHCRVATGIIWQFRYDASLPAWLFIGGPPLFSEVATAEALTSASYTALATAGPAITLPRAGDYDVEISAGMSCANAKTPVMSYDIGGTGAVDADALRIGTVATSTAVFSGVRLRRKTGLTAVTLTAKYKSNDTVSVTVQDRWMRVTPQRWIT